MDLTAWYFPNLNLTVDLVLLSGACVWDRWKRIVPFGVRPRDGNVAKGLDSELGFFEPVEIEDDVSGVDDQFVDWIEGGFERMELPYVSVLGKIAVERTAAKPQRLLKAERHPKLTAKLEAHGLLKDYAANWKATSRLLQELYLTCLCQYTRSRRPGLQSIPLVADDLRFVRAAMHAHGGFGEESGICVTLELPYPVPMDWRYTDRVDYAALRALREASREARREYLQAVEQCVSHVSVADKAAQLPTLIRAHTRPVVQAYKEIIQAGTRYGVPLERGYLIANWLSERLQAEARIAGPKAMGDAAYTITDIPLAKGGVEKVMGDGNRIYVVSPEIPLVRRTRGQRMGEKVRRVFGGI